MDKDAILITVTDTQCPFAWKKYSAKVFEYGTFRKSQCRLNVRRDVAGSINEHSYPPWCQAPPTGFQVNAGSMSSAGTRHPCYRGAGTPLLGVSNFNRVGIALGSLDRPMSSSRPGDALLGWHSVRPRHRQTAPLLRPLLSPAGETAGFAPSLPSPSQFFDRQAQVGG